MCPITGDHLDKVVSATIPQCKITNVTYIVKKYFKERYFQSLNISQVIKLSIICQFMYLYILEFS